MAFLAVHGKGWDFSCRGSFVLRLVVLFGFSAAPPRSLSLSKIEFAWLFMLSGVALSWLDLGWACERASRYSFLDCECDCGRTEEFFLERRKD